MVNSLQNTVCFISTCYKLSQLVSSRLLQTCIPLLHPPLIAFLCLYKTEIGITQLSTTVTSALAVGYGLWRHLVTSLAYFGTLTPFVGGKCLYLCYPWSNSIVLSLSARARPSKCLQCAAPKHMSSRDRASVNCCVCSVWKGKVWLSGKLHSLGSFVTK